MLNGLLDRALVLFVLHLFLKFSSLDFLIGCHVGIENLPLGSLQGEVRLYRGISFDAALFQRKVEGLARSLLVVELVAERFLLSPIVSINYMTFKKGKF